MVNLFLKWQIYFVVWSSEDNLFVRSQKSMGIMYCLCFLLSETSLQLRKVTEKLFLSAISMTWTATAAIKVLLPQPLRQRGHSHLAWPSWQVYILGHYTILSFSQSLSLLHHFHKFTIIQIFFWVALTYPLLCMGYLFITGQDSTAQIMTYRFHHCATIKLLDFCYTQRLWYRWGKWQKTLFYLPSVRLKQPFWWSKYILPNQLA